jgi:hypothetical protein
MTARNLSRRLKQLEAVITPPIDPPQFMTINFVGPDGKVVDTRVIKVGGRPRETQ